MRWQDKLTNVEMEHVREFGGRTLKGFKLNRAVQLEMIRRDKDKDRAEMVEPCFLCKQIARKLGLEGGTNDA